MVLTPCGGVALGADRLDGGNDNNTRAGGDGADVFVTNAAFADLTGTTNGTGITVTWNNDTLTLTGVTGTPTLTAQDFIFI